MPPLVDAEMVSQIEGQAMMVAERLAKAFVKGLISKTMRSL
jgi:hypothetical protein